GSPVRSNQSRPDRIDVCSDPPARILGASLQAGRNMESGIFALVLVVVAVIVLAKMVRIVPQGFEWTVERFGRYTRTLSPGLHFLVPFVYGIGHRMNMMEQVLDVPSQD